MVTSGSVVVLTFEELVARVAELLKAGAAQENIDQS